MTFLQVNPECDWWTNLSWPQAIVLVFLILVLGFLFFLIIRTIG